MRTLVWLRRLSLSRASDRLSGRGETHRDFSCLLLPLLVLLLCGVVEAWLTLLVSVSVSSVSCGEEELATPGT